MKRMKRIIVLGGDGFCGWPTSLHLSNIGHEVLIIDNLSRRNIDNEINANSLTPIASVQTRLQAWKEVSGKSIEFVNIDICKEYSELLGVLSSFRPDVIVHFAEQRSAPYSMKSSKHKRYTVDNNISGTNNLMAAVVEAGLDPHIIHLGSMGVYGYGTVNMKIPEGYLEIYTRHDEEYRQSSVLYPVNPGSIYHLTKTQDQLLFAYYNSNDHIRVTDLHQGVVWGTDTQETKMDERLINRFDYDGDYGTVLNRFIMQAAVDYPLTVHGSGGQTRAFIHIQDTVRCIELAVDSEPKKEDKVRILNQMTETHRVRDLAQMVANITGAKIDFVPNPRNEDDENELHVENSSLIKMGLDPITLSHGLLSEVKDISEKYSHRVDKSLIPCVSYWNKDRMLAKEI